MQPGQGAQQMQAITVSPKFQVVIPQAVREALAIMPGNTMQVIAYDGRIELFQLWPYRACLDSCGWLEYLANAGQCRLLRGSH
jgi:AbrB family looped-hinge helix DNA binding protein